MKTAVIITGHMRSFDRCILSQVKRVFGALDDPHFFVSTITDEDAHKAELLRNYFRGVDIAITAEQPDCIAELRAKGCALPARWKRGEHYMREPIAITAHPQAIARQLWQLEQGWHMVGAPSRFDQFVRIRPDLLFHHCEMPATHGNLVRVPWWGRFHGCNDRFAIMGAAAAERYFTTYSRVAEMIAAGASLHPETLLKRSLDSGGVAIDASLGAVFSTLRPNGDVRPPEIWEEDINTLAATQAAEAFR